MWSEYPDVFVEMQKCFTELVEISFQDKAEDVLNKLKADIQAKEEELNEIAPKYNALVEEAAKLSTE